MQKQKNFKLTRNACYFAYIAVSVIFALPPILFITFREMYGISYTALGTLIFVNFCTQMAVDLAFSFFPKYFNIHRSLKAMPLLTASGLLIYAIVPTLWPQYAYAGMVVGTVIFSVSAGLSEVLISPTVAALPSDNPDRDMSALHSLYGYGVLSVVVLSTVFLKFFGTENWMYLTLGLAVLPLISFVLFHIVPLSEYTISHPKGEGRSKRRILILGLCMLCIFMGSAAENAMMVWISSFIENALHLPKAAGDVLGMAVFAILLAFTRTVYAKYGKNILSVLIFSMLGAIVFYLVAGLSANVIIAMIACVLLGICTSMLWPGTLILMEERLPNPGVAAYALMAAGGDCGASVAPQIVGVVVDEVAESAWAARLGETYALSTEQIGMKVGILSTVAFPVLGLATLLIMKRYFSKKHQLDSLGGKQ